MDKIQLTEKEQKARERICFALDYENTLEARKDIFELYDLVGMLKVGKGLHTIATNYGAHITGIIQRAYDEDRINNEDRRNVFLDLKFHDTPKTIYYSARAAASGEGVRMFSVHVDGGELMCKKAIEGSRDAKNHRRVGDERFYSAERPKVIGVTVLSSLNDKDLRAQGWEITLDDLVRKRTELARKWGLDGVVCPANKAGQLEKEFGSDFLYVTPGIEWAGKKGEGQKQLYTPDKAVRDCNNSILVIGSAIREAKNKRKTTYEIIKAMAREL